MTPRSRASDRQAVVNVTGTCAQRSRWSRLRALAARASFIGGLAVGAWLGTAAVGSAAPGSEPALAQSIEASVAGTASAAANSAEDTTAGETDDVGSRLMSVIRAEQVRPAKPVAPEPVEPVEPAAPEIAHPDPVEITAPATPATASVAADDDIQAEHTDVAVGLAPPPAPPAPPDAHPFSKSAKSPDATEDTTGTTSNAHRLRPHSPEPPEPAEPVAGQDKGQPAPVQVPPAPTMTTASSATGSGGGPRVLAILPTDAWQPRPAAAAVGPQETVPLRGTVSVEPSTSPD